MLDLEVGLELSHSADYRWDIYSINLMRITKQFFKNSTIYRAVTCWKFPNLVGIVPVSWLSLRVLLNKLNSIYNENKQNNLFKRE